MHQFDLFCVPYAGGSASSIYGKWSSELAPDIKVRPLELAGRGRRMSEPFAFTIQAVVEDLLEVIRPHISNRPYAIFGHSMGSVIAYELAMAAQAEGLPAPIALFVSGRLPPHYNYSESQIHDAPDDVFIEHIKEIGGTPQEFFLSDELIRLFLPILRNDYRIIEKYVYVKSDAALQTDLVVFYSDDDKMVTKPNIYQWEKYVTGLFEHYEYSGDHFFLNKEWVDLCRIIRHKLLTKHNSIYSTVSSIAKGE